MGIGAALQKFARFVNPLRRRMTNRWGLAPLFRSSRTVCDDFTRSVKGKGFGIYRVGIFMPDASSGLIGILPFFSFIAGIRFVEEWLVLDNEISFKVSFENKIEKIIRMRRIFIIVINKLFLINYILYFE